MIFDIVRYSGRNLVFKGLNRLYLTDGLEVDDWNRRLKSWSLEVYRSLDCES